MARKALQEESEAAGGKLSSGAVKCKLFPPEFCDDRTLGVDVSRVIQAANRADSVRSYRVSSERLSRTKSKEQIEFSSASQRRVFIPWPFFF